jgi:hypothetical protein
VPWWRQRNLGCDGKICDYTHMLKKPMPLVIKLLFANMIECESLMACNLCSAAGIPKKPQAQICASL